MVCAPLVASHIACNCPSSLVHKHKPTLQQLCMCSYSNVHEIIVQLATLLTCSVQGCVQGCNNLVNTTKMHVFHLASYVQGNKQIVLPYKICMYSHSILACSITMASTYINSLFGDIQLQIATLIDRILSYHSKQCSLSMLKAFLLYLQYTQLQFCVTISNLASRCEIYYWDTVLLF